MLHFSFSIKTSPEVSEASYWHVKRRFLPAVHVAKLYCSAVYTVNPSLLPAILIKIMFQTHGRWRNPPPLVMANSANMAVSLSQSKRAVSDSVKQKILRFCPFRS